MIRGPILAFFVMCFPIAALANAAKVKADGFPTYTRIVLEFENRPGWEAERLPTGYRVVFRTSSAINFDLSGVFQNADRARLGDVRPHGFNGIEFDVVCDCDTLIEPSGKDAMVVEIRDRVSSSLSAPLAGNTEISLPGQDMAMAGGEVSRLAPQSMAVEIPLNVGLSAGNVPIVLDQLDFLAPNQGQSVAVDLVGRALSRAVSQGLVLPDEDIAPRSITGTEVAAEALDDRTNISVTTGFDQVILPLERAVPPTENGVFCLPDSSVDVASWGSPNDMRRLGELRSAAVAENGMVDPDGAEDLARFYIALSFGAEASVVAKKLKSESAKALINAFAQIMDQGQTDLPVFEGQLFCDGAVAMWAALASPIDPANTPETPNHILSTFSALPAHLRSHLGPLLSERLRNAGMDSAARTSINAVTRGGKKTEESTLAIARLDLDGSEANEARNVLSDLSNGTDLTAAEALLELMRDAESRGVSPNPAWVEDAPTLVGALEGTDVAKDLNIAGLRGLVALGRYDNFRTALIDDTPGLNEESRKSLAIHALKRATLEADSFQFVKAEIGLSNITKPSDLDPMARLAIARRLLDLGLVTRSLLYAESVPADFDQLSVLIDGLIANGQPDRAVQVILDSPVANADDLLGTAFELAGRHGEALSAFEKVGEIEKARSAALRTANWNWIEASNDLAFAEPVTALTDPISMPNQTAENPNGALIDVSRQRREQIKILLNATQLDNEPEQFTN